jgi:DNA-binding Lrp family transcriptional regulator
LKDTELKLVCMLLRNCRKSDRELAKLIGVSQPTVSRTRTRLEKEGVIRYTGAADLRKLGYDIIAISFGNWKHPQYPDVKELKTQDFLTKHPNVIFASTGRGFNSDRVSISVHKTYSDYSAFVQELRSDWGEHVTLTGSFLMSLRSDNVIRPISLTYLAECLEKERSEQRPKT